MWDLRDVCFVQELANIQNTWNTLELDIVPYKDKGHFKVRNTEEANQALDDHMTKLGTACEDPRRLHVLVRVRVLVLY